MPETLFLRFAAEGILNPATGKDYRDMILRPGMQQMHKKISHTLSILLKFSFSQTGASLDGGVMLRNFLGREPNQDAFLRLGKIHKMEQQECILDTNVERC